MTKQRVRVVGPDGTVVHGSVLKIADGKIRVAFPREGRFAAATGMGVGTCASWRIHPEDFAALDKPAEKQALDELVLAAMTGEPQRSRAIWTATEAGPPEREVDYYAVCGALRRLVRQGAVAKHAKGKTTLWSKNCGASCAREKNMNEEEKTTVETETTQPVDGVAVPPKSKGTEEDQDGVFVPPVPKVEEPTGESADSVAVPPVPKADEPTEE